MLTQVAIYPRFATPARIEDPLSLRFFGGAKQSLPLPGTSGFLKSVAASRDQQTNPSLAVLVEGPLVSPEGRHRGATLALLSSSLFSSPLRPSRCQRRRFSGSCRSSPPPMAGSSSRRLDLRGASWICRCLSPDALRLAPVCIAYWVVTFRVAGHAHRWPCLSHAARPGRRAVPCRRFALPGTAWAPAWPLRAAVASCGPSCWVSGLPLLAGSVLLILGRNLSLHSWVKDWLPFARVDALLLDVLFSLLVLKLCSPLRLRCVAMLRRWSLH